MLIKNFFGHLRTVNSHRHMVMLHCFKAGIFRRGLLHDLSKYSPTEFIPGVLYFQGSRSPNERERELKGASSAWMHHKGRNRHHYEFWTDYSIQTKRMEPMPMPTRFVLEMLADRMAASKVYKGEAYTDSSPLEYYQQASDHMLIHPKTRKQLEFLLRMLARDGEDKTFRYIRTRIMKKRI